MNQQQILNKACEHLAHQKRTTWSIAGTCLYLSPEGLKCTVGCLMSEEQLKAYGSYEGYVSLLETHAREAGDSVMADFLRDNRSILEALQKAHDGDKCDAREMRVRLIGVARTFGLDDTAVNKIEEWDG